MSTPQLDRLHAYCHRLRLYQVESELPTLLEQAAKQDRSYSDFLEDLLRREVQAKGAKHLAMRLAMALGADVSALMERRGLLKQSGETVCLLGPKERGKSDELGLPDRSGRLAGVIDVLHRAAVLWEKGDRDGLARFLTDAAQGREEQLRLVAQTIANILPDDDPERRLLEGFLQGRDVLPDVPKQGRLM